MDLPERPGNLADRKPQHNRRSRARFRGVVPRLCHVDLCISSRYARQDFPLSQVSVSHEANMTTFDKREEGFEKKFAHDEELRFKANARRNKLLGLWAAEKLGISGDAANAYAKDVVMSDFEEGGDHDVFKKVRKDLDAKGVALSDQDLRHTMIELMEKAIAEVKASG
jgi:hypothetical protein